MKDHSRNHINFEPFSKREKAQLKKRISKSIFGLARRRKIGRYGKGIAALTLLALFAVGIYMNVGDDESKIESFANTLNDFKTDDHIQLVLSDDRQIEIEDEQTMISYSKTGDHVQIGKGKSLNQPIANNEDGIFNTLIVPYGKRSEIQLSDGTKVWLNSGSKLVFPANFSSEIREVYLEGEAIFEVAHRQNQPFTVTSKHHEIQVLGTVFNVSNYVDDPAIYTVLESGSIQINVDRNHLFGGQKTFQMVPGTLATFDRSQGTVSQKTVDTASYFSWRDGIFIFKNDSLTTIMKRIARYYNVEVIINDPDLANVTFSGYLDVKEDIEKVMKTIKETETSKFEYHLTSDRKLIIN